MLETPRRLSGIGWRATALSIERTRGSAVSGPVAPSSATLDPPTLLPRRSAAIPARHILSEPPTSFVGREHDLAEVVRLLQVSRLVTLVGMGGVGKTRLALQVANGLATAYPDGLALVELGAVTEPALVARAVASALGHRDEGSMAVDGAGDRLVEALSAAIRERTCLIVLDNCEHVVDAIADLIDRLLRGSPNLRILATSHEPIAVDGEAIWRVYPLALTEPAAGGDRPSGAEQSGYSDAVRLFLDRARAASPHFTITPESASAVDLICCRLDGIPLAIELAAARLRGLPLSAIVDGLVDRYGLLTSGNRVAPARHRTLRSLVDWSFDLLTGEERALLCRLTVFAGSFSLAAAEAVGQIEGRGLDLLPRLVEKSLVVLDQSDGQARFRLLDTLREYASEKLRQAGEEEATRQRYVHWCCRFAELGEARLRTTEHDRSIARVGQEHDNLRLAIAWSIAEPRDDSGPRIVGALCWFWEIRGHHVEAMGYLERALALIDSRAVTTSPTLRAKLLNGLGLFSYACGSYRAAAAYAEQALDLCRRAGDDQAACLALATLGYIAQFDGDSDRAGELLGEGRALAERDDDTLHLAHVLYGLGVVEHGRGNYQGASDLYARSLALWRGLGAAARVALAQTLLARMVHLLGDDVQAAGLLEEAVEAGRAAGSPRAMGWSLLYLGHIMRARGDLDRAVTLYVESLDQRAVARDRRGLAQCLEALAAVSALRAVHETHPDIGRAEAAHAATLFGAAEAIREAVSACILPCERAGYARDVAAVRGKLGSALAKHWTAGRGLSLDDVVNLGRSTPHQQRPAARTTGPVPPVLLSRREREVIILIAQGLSSRQIADALSIAKRTADTHAWNILNKLGVSTRREAAVWAVQHGLLPCARPVAMSESPM